MPRKISVQVDTSLTTSETDKVSRIKKRFELLETMVAAEHWRGIIISGPPGIGKTYNTIKYLENQGTHYRYRGRDQDD